jgi:hypothetical protein
MSQDTHELQYAPPILKHRKFIRPIVLTLIVVIGVAASLPMLSHEFARLKAVRLYHRCEGSTTTNVVFQIQGGTVDSKLFHAAKKTPWSELNEAMGTNIQTYGTVFTGLLTTPSTHTERLIGVDIVNVSINPAIIGLHARTIELAGRMGTPRYTVARDETLMFTGDARVFRLYGGARDPNDASHFTIAYERNGHAGVIDGWLKADLGVSFEFRDQPTTAPAPPSAGKSR